MQTLPQRAKQDASVYLSEARRRFDETGVRYFAIGLTRFRKARFPF